MHEPCEFPTGTATKVRYIVRGHYYWLKGFFGTPSQVRVNEFRGDERKSKVVVVGEGRKKVSVEIQPLHFGHARFANAHDLYATIGDLLRAQAEFHEASALDLRRRAKLADEEDAEREYVNEHFDEIQNAGDLTDDEHDLSASLGY